MKPPPNRTSTFPRIRLSPDSLSLRIAGIRDSVWCGGLVPPVLACSPSLSAEALRPATALPVALGGRDSTGYYGLSAPMVALAISPPTSPALTRQLLEPTWVPAWLASQVLCCRRCPFDPFTWRTRLGTGQTGCKARLTPALPHNPRRLRGVPPLASGASLGSPTPSPSFG